MSFRAKYEKSHTTLIRSLPRGLLAASLMLVLGACSSQAAREAELAAEEAAQVASQQEAAQLAQQQARERAAAEQRQREALAAERVRQQALREREDAARLARAEEERRQREEAERREQQRLAAIAAAEAERQQKIDRIAELEQQIASIQGDTSDNEEATALLQEAVLVAEELLDVLAAEQAKYDNTDADGNTVDALAKDLIAELENRKDDLVRQAGSN